jgi:hypothetical protein
LSEKKRYETITVVRRPKGGTKEGQGRDEGGTRKGRGRDEGGIREDK